MKDFSISMALQSIGFLLAGAGIVGMLWFKPKKGTTLLSAAPVVWSGPVPFCLWD